jgi:3-oxoacyl-[acyl-carrier-protein] synthase III
MTHSTIAGTGGYLPARVMTNKEFEKIVDTSDEWIRERSGIKRRHIAADGETTSDMALAAARSAIEAAGVANDDIDLIIVATNTGFRCARGLFGIHLRAGHRGPVYSHGGRQLRALDRLGDLFPHSRLE